MKVESVSIGQDVSQYSRCVAKGRYNMLWKYHWQNFSNCWTSLKKELERPENILTSFQSVQLPDDGAN